MAEPATEAGSSDSLEGQIEQWRSYLRRRQAIRPVDVEELEDHLRGEVAALRGAGLSENEAFLVAVKRMGALDAISNEFAREHSERLWKQLVIASTGTAQPVDEVRTETIVVFALAVVAALAVKVPELFGLEWGGRDMPFYLRNFSLFVFPLLTGYFVWKRRLSRAHLGVAGPGVRGRGRFRQCLSVRDRQRHGGADRVAPADRAVAARGDRLRGRALGGERRAHGLRPLLRRAVHLLRADRAGRRGSHRRSRWGCSRRSGSMPSRWSRIGWCRAGWSGR